MKNLLNSKLEIMKAKQYIYHWLFFPLLASLLAGSATSCINDPAMEEEDMSGKTTLSVTVRGVSKDPVSDEYINTLRIIVLMLQGRFIISFICRMILRSGI